MWGENTRPSSRRDGASAVASVDGESDITVTDTGQLPLHNPSDDEEQNAFRRRSARFDEAERSFNSLMRSLDEHKAALSRVAESGVAVAEKLNNFFSAKDAHRELASSFLMAQRNAREKWTGFERRYERDVVSHIKNRVDEIPVVRDLIKQRATALTEMRKLQRKTASERKTDGPFAKVKKRRLKELKDVSAVYAMHHSDVMRRFSQIERNFGNFVSPALVSLISLLDETNQASVKSLENVKRMVTVVPPMTRELSPAPMLDSQGNPGVTTSDTVGETWDEDFDDPMLSPASSPPMQAGTASLTLPPAEASSSVAHTRSRSEPATGVPGTVSTPARRRGIHSTDTSSLPEVLHENSYVPADDSSTTIPNPTRVGASGSSSSGERVGDADGGSVTGNGGGSEMSGRGRERLKHENRDRRRGREGMGSSDTVPSESGGIGRSEVLMRLLVLYDFSPREVNEIELRKGDVVEVSGKTDSGWWYGRCRKNAGFFPKNYTRELTDQEEADFVSNRHRRPRRHGHRRRDSRESRRSGKSTSVAGASASATATTTARALVQP